VHRRGERRELCALSLNAPDRAARVLTPGFTLSVKLARDRALRPGEKSDIEDLRAALGFLLETLHRQGSGPRTGTASMESHEGIEGRDFLLRTTFACNQRCPFCFVPAGRSVDFSAIESELRALALRHGTREALTISGGEPTVDPRLPRILAAARHIGFKKFRVQTNAVLLARPGLLEKLVAAGARDYMVSLHSHLPEHYDRLTGSHGQYQRAVAGLTRLLAAERCDVTVNVVVNKLNTGDLPALMDFLAGLRDRAGRGRRLTVHFSMINEIGHERTPQWAVDLAAVTPLLREAVRRCLRHRLPISRIGGESAFPLCLLEQPRRHAVNRVFAQDRVRYAEDFSGKDGAIGRAKRPGCKDCPYDLRCMGVPASYARRFGLAALQPPRRL
jgi:pyruvate-formate lyase-activating enzyme